MKNIPELNEKGYRDFAITTGGVLAIIFGGFLPWLFDYAYPYWPWVVLLILLLWGFLAAATLRPIYVGWMTVALLISRITTPVILGIVFYVVISPVALIFRILKKDPMRRLFEHSNDTYRVPSERKNHDHLERPF